MIMILKCYSKVLKATYSEISLMTKTISFAIMHFAIAFSVAYALSGSFIVGGAIAIVEPAINTVGYYFHEKIWARRHIAAQAFDVDRNAAAMFKA
ncbi:DUF2061 domain-containing protein [Thalassolituus sp. UBA2590]|uniref:DUF2061 domain-containing protein n=1 Tax=Thalassolituus sp. UBA2590 TaxID=1947663 RepID=UPI0032E372D8